jgi:hypothetical protein
MAELVASPAQRKFARDKLDTLPQFCLDCDVRFAATVVRRCDMARLRETHRGPALSTNP